MSLLMPVFLLLLSGVLMLLCFFIIQVHAVVVGSVVVHIVVGCIGSAVLYIVVVCVHAFGILC